MYVRYVVTKLHSPYVFRLSVVPNLSVKLHFINSTYISGIGVAKYTQPWFIKYFPGEISVKWSPIIIDINFPLPPEY